MMKALLTNKYFIAYLVSYILVLLSGQERFAVEEALVLFFLYGVVFTALALVLTHSSDPIFTDKPDQKNELLMIILLVLLFTGFITFYKDLLFLAHRELNPGTPTFKLLTAGLKIIFIVAIPVLAYKFAYGFGLKDWGISNRLAFPFSKNNLVIFFTFLILISLLQYFMSNGFKPVKEGEYSVYQLLVGIPLNFLWLLFTVGFVEEFFFRAFLQSRLSVLLHSQIGGIIISATIFGLAHAPGIYLRGSGVVANLGADPGLFLSIAYSFVALSVAGFFLAVIWARTKNFWLIAAIHAVVDLLPGLSEFIEYWGL